MTRATGIANIIVGSSFLVVAAFAALDIPDEIARSGHEREDLILVFSLGVLATLLGSLSITAGVILIRRRSAGPFWLRGLSIACVAFCVLLVGMSVVTCWVRGAGWLVELGCLWVLALWLIVSAVQLRRVQKTGREGGGRPSS
jgi:hypothetical protein